MEETKKRGRKRKADTSDTIKLTDVIDNSSDAVTLTETTTIAVLSDSKISDESIHAVTESTTHEELIVKDNAAPVNSKDSVSSEDITDSDSSDKKKDDNEEMLSNGAILFVSFAKMYSSSVATNPFNVVRGQIVIIDCNKHDGRIRVMCLYGKNSVGWVNVSDIV